MDPRPLPSAALATLLLAVPAATQATPYGSGCGGLSIDSTGSPGIGSTTFAATLSGGPPSSPGFLNLGVSDSSWLGLPLPLDGGLLGAPGCQVLASVDTLFTVATDGSGSIHHPLPIPCAPAIAGQSVFLQIAVVSPGANPLSLLLSDGLEVAIEDGSFEEELYQFLDSIQWPSGLVESFRVNPGLDPGFQSYLNGSRPAFLYDNALAALAWLDRATASDLARARDLLDAMISLQDPMTGSLPAAVNVAHLWVVDPTSSTGNMCWCMLALLKGYDVLGDAKYLDAAELAGSFVLGQKNTIGYGGFGLNPGHAVGSTEHNTDAFAAFERLAAALPSGGGALLTPQQARDAAKHARIFVEAMVDPVTGVLFTGTIADGITKNTFPIPEDPQSWGLLSQGNAKFLDGLAYVTTPAPNGLWNVSTTCPTLGGVTIEGPSFSSASTIQPWFEGLAQTRLAAQLAGDTATDETGACVLQAVQEHAPFANQLGLVAVCDSLDTGFGFAYHNALAAAPTAWAILSERRTNPFWDIPTDGGLAAHPAGSIPTVSLDTPFGATVSCPTGDPCHFPMSGTSTGVVGEPDLAIFLVVEPVSPSAGAIFTQFQPVTLDPDGSWSTTGILGSAQFPAASGHTLRVCAIVYDTSSGGPPAVVSAVTPDTYPGLVAMSGALEATAVVGP